MRGTDTLHGGVGAAQALLPHQHHHHRRSRVVSDPGGCQRLIKSTASRLTTAQAGLGLKSPPLRLPQAGGSLCVGEAAPRAPAPLPLAQPPQKARGAPAQGKRRCRAGGLHQRAAQERRRNGDGTGSGASAAPRRPLPRRQGQGRGAREQSPPYPGSERWLTRPPHPIPFSPLHETPQTSLSPIFYRTRTCPRPP